ncbi:putative glycosyl transferase, partial [Oceanicola granulosus HTCC2516]
MTTGQGRLAAIVVTHNRLEKLQATLARLLAEPAERLHHVVVVDNASTDATPDWLAVQKDPRLEVLRLAKNGGGAGGFEAGMRHVAERFDPDWTLVMDDDARPAEGALAAFHGAPRDGREAWAAAVYYPDGRICEMNQPWINPFWHREAFLRTLRAGRGGFHLGAEAYDAPAPTEIDGGSFVGLFLSRRALALAGYPDGRLFIYGDDVLYTLGLTAAGGRIAFDPEIRFEHDCATLGTGPQVFRPLWKTYYHHRNLTMVYKRAAGLWYWPATMVFLPKWVSKVRHHEGSRAAYLRLLARAVRDGLTGRLDLTHDEVVALAER